MSTAEDDAYWRGVDLLDEAQVGPAIVENTERNAAITGAIVELERLNEEIKHERWTSRSLVRRSILAEMRDKIDARVMELKTGLAVTGDA